jgi:hypothetical protein
VRRLKYEHYAAGQKPVAGSVDVDILISRIRRQPNNLQQTGLRVRGKEEFLPRWSIVFNASTGINPNSVLLADASKTNIVNSRGYL